MENLKKDLPFDVSLTDLTRAQTFHLLVLLICNIENISISPIWPQNPTVIDFESCDPKTLKLAQKMHQKV